MPTPETSQPSLKDRLERRYRHSKPAYLTAVVLSSFAGGAIAGTLIERLGLLQPSETGVERVVDYSNVSNQPPFFQERPDADLLRTGKYNSLDRPVVHDAAGETLPSWELNRRIVSKLEEVIYTRRRDLGQYPWMSDAERFSYEINPGLIPDALREPLEQEVAIEAEQDAYLMDRWLDQLPPDLQYDALHFDEIPEARQRSYADRMNRFDENHDIMRLSGSDIAWYYVEGNPVAGLEFAYLTSQDIEYVVGLEYQRRMVSDRVANIADQIYGPASRESNEYMGRENVPRLIVPFENDLTLEAQRRAFEWLEAHGFEVPCNGDIPIYVGNIKDPREARAFAPMAEDGPIEQGCKVTVTSGTPGIIRREATIFNSETSRSQFGPAQWEAAAQVYCQLFIHEDLHNIGVGHTATNRSSPMYVDPEGKLARTFDPSECEGS